MGRPAGSGLLGARDLSLYLITQDTPGRPLEGLLDLGPGAELLGALQRSLITSLTCTCREATFQLHKKTVIPVP